MEKTALVILFGVAVMVAAEIVEINKCDGVQDNKCSVNEIRITPCVGAPIHCRLKRGYPYEIAFDFKPEFSATKLRQEVKYLDTLWSDLNTEACLFTTCPTEAGKMQTLNYSLTIGKRLPKGQFVFPWKVIDEADENNVCCFKMTVRIVK